jgi:hypothetical protein
MIYHPPSPSHITLIINITNYWSQRKHGTKVPRCILNFLKDKLRIYCAKVYI